MRPVERVRDHLAGARRPGEPQTSPRLTAASERERAAQRDDAAREGAYRLSALGLRRDKALLQERRSGGRARRARRARGR